MNDLPDLPSLERVEANLTSEALPIAGVALFAATGVTAAFVLLYLRYRGYFGAQAVIIQAAIGVFALLAVWVVVKALGAICRWSSDPDGLTGRSVLRTIRIRWSDVSRATSRRTAYGETSHVLETGDGRRMTVTPYRSGFGLTAIQASIWQHLRRAGRAESLELPESAVSLWDEIPDSVPSSIEWTDPGSRLPMWIFLSLIAFGLVVMTVGMTSSAWRRGDARGVAASAVFGLVLAGLLACLLRSTCRIPVRIVTDDASIETTAPGSGQTMRWEDVASARWVRMEGDGGYGLDIRAVDGKPGILVPYRTSSEAPAMLILSVIRRLRTAGHPQAVPIPDRLRAKLG